MISLIGAQIRHTDCMVKSLIGVKELDPALLDEAQKLDQTLLKYITLALRRMADGTANSRKDAPPKPTPTTLSLAHLNDTNYEDASVEDESDFGITEVKIEPNNEKCSNEPLVNLTGVEQHSISNISRLSAEPAASDQSNSQESRFNSNPTEVTEVSNDSISNISRLSAEPAASDQSNSQESRFNSNPTEVIEVSNVSLKDCQLSTDLSSVNKKTLSSASASIDPQPSSDACSCIMCSLARDPSSVSIAPIHRSPTLKCEKFKTSSRGSTLKCNQCRFKTTLPESFCNHLQEHETKRPVFKCHKCQFTTQKLGELQHHRNKHPLALVECDVCDYSTYNEQNLNKHKMKHIKNIDRPFKCTMCSYAGLTVVQLKSHQNGVHSTKIIACSSCCYNAKSGALLKRHVLARHSDVRPFACEVCGWRVKRKDHLIMHMKQHRGKEDQIAFSRLRSGHPLPTPQTCYTTSYAKQTPPNSPTISDAKQTSLISPIIVNENKEKLKNETLFDDVIFL